MKVIFKIISIVIQFYKLPLGAFIELDIGSTVCSEGDGYLDVCAVITDLPAGGLEIDITVFFNITSTAVNSPGLVTDCKKTGY